MKDMSVEVDLEDLPPKTVRKMLRAFMSKTAKSEEEKDEDAERAEKDRDELSKLHAEGNGDPPAVPVTEDDLPEELRPEPKKKGKKKGKYG